MNRFMILLCCILSQAVCICAEDSNRSSEFGDKIRVPTNIGFATSVSDDKQVATVIFDNAFVELDAVRSGARGAANQTAEGSKVITVRIPYSTDQRSVKMTMDVRGFVDADSGAKARLIVAVGDATQIVDTGSSDSNVKLKGKTKEEFGEGSSQYNDFEDRVKFTLQTHAAEPVCQVTLMFLLTRDTDTDEAGGVLLVVDSLDLQIAKGGKAKLR